MKLVLDDGTEFVGTSFGSDQGVAGEVVFNTGMNGYIETLTDPSYCGQILTFTYPLIGNYGVPAAREKGSLSTPFESNSLQIQAVIVQNYIEKYSHHLAQRSLGDWLKSENIPAISGIDTRRLTRLLRSQGTMRGWVLPADGNLRELKNTLNSVEMQTDVFRKVAPDQITRYDGGDTTIMLVDVGAKDNIVRSLLSRGVSVLRVPWYEDIKQLSSQVDGIVIGNGPGDPQNLGQLIQSLRDIMRDYRKPIFGICLGNQILVLAAGGSTYKLPYGHRGVNQPVQNLLTRKCYITSQNHGYAVQDESLPEEWEAWFININDGTNEGVRSQLRPYYGVQFHPESCPGPEDTAFMFDDFLKLVNSIKIG